MVEVSACDVRVSPRKVLKHFPARFDWVRSRPPSKNSDVLRVWPTSVPGLTFLAVSQGVVMVFVLDVAQVASPAVVSGDVQSTPCATGVVFSEPGTFGGSITQVGPGHVPVRRSQR